MKDKAFNAKAQAWEAYTQTAPGRLRETLNWQYLMPHLPDAPAHILDVGSGTGGLGLRLAQDGHHVHLLDFSEGMLNIARDKAQGLENPMQFTCAAVEDWQPETAFDVVICHTLLEYVTDVPAVLRRLAEWLREGGILSVAFVNQYAEPLTLALGKGKLDAAITSLDATSAAADLFGVSRQLFTSQQIQDIIQPLSLILIAEYGVRVIADYLANPEWKENELAYAELVTLEFALAPHFPYRYIGRYGQLVYRK